MQVSQPLVLATRQISQHLPVSTQFQVSQSTGTGSEIPEQPQVSQPVGVSPSTDLIGISHRILPELQEDLQNLLELATEVQTELELSDEGVAQAIHVCYTFLMQNWPL